MNRNKKSPDSAVYGRIGALFLHFCAAVSVIGLVQTEIGEPN